MENISIKQRINNAALANIEFVTIAKWQKRRKIKAKSYSKVFNEERKVDSSSSISKNE